MNVRFLSHLVLIFIIITNLVLVEARKKSRHGKITRPRKKAIQDKLQIRDLGIRRAMGPESDDTDKADCEMVLTKNTQADNSKDVLLGSKGVVAALGGKNMTLICMLKAFDIMKGENGVILRKSKTGVTMVTNDEVSLEDMLNGKMDSKALHIGVAGQSSLRTGLGQDDSSAGVNAKDDKAEGAVNTKTYIRDGRMETSGSASGSLEMVKKGRKKLRMNTDEDTTFDSNKKPHSRNDEVGSVSHAKKTSFEIDI